MTPVERVLANTRPVGDCLEFQGVRGNGGYGRIRHEGRMVAATRVVATERLGLDLADRSTHVCHACDNPPCVNPAHLFLGTASENCQDAIAKGRRPALPPSTRPWDFCAKGHDMSETREKKTGKAGGTHCGVCRRERHAAGERRRRAERKARAA